MAEGVEREREREIKAKYFVSEVKLVCNEGRVRNSRIAGLLGGRETSRKQSLEWEEGVSTKSRQGIWGRGIILERVSPNS